MFKPAPEEPAPRVITAAGLMRFAEVHGRVKFFRRAGTGFG